MGDQRVRVEREAPAQRVVVARRDADLERGPLGDLPRLGGRERARGRRHERLDLGERREERRRRCLDDVGRRLVGHEDAAARQENGDHEGEPERGGADHPACSRTVLRRACARLHCASCGSAVASTAFGFPRWASATSTARPWLHALRADETETSAARCAWSFRRSVSVRAFWLASWRCRCVSAPRLTFVSRNAPRLDASVSTGRWPAASAGSASGCAPRARPAARRRPPRRRRRAAASPRPERCSSWRC